MKIDRQNHSNHLNAIFFVNILAVPKVRQMFERMQMLPSLESESTALGGQETKRLNLTTGWRTINYSVPILNQVCPLNDTDKACDFFETCVLNFSMLLKEVEQKLLLKRPINYESERNRSWIHTATVNGAFYAGILVGSVFGGSCIFLVGTICSKGFCSRKTADRESRRGNRSVTESESRDGQKRNDELSIYILIHFSHFQEEDNRGKTDLNRNQLFPLSFQ